MCHSPTLVSTAARSGCQRGGCWANGAPRDGARGPTRYPKCTYRQALLPEIATPPLVMSVLVELPEAASLKHRSTGSVVHVNLCVNASLLIPTAVPNAHPAHYLGDSFIAVPLALATILSADGLDEMRRRRVTILIERVRTCGSETVVVITEDYDQRRLYGQLEKLKVNLDFQLVVGRGIYWLATREVAEIIERIMIYFKPPKSHASA